MAGYLIAEEGPLSGMLVSFEEGNEWILGRDPDEASIVLEDPMVSRKHVICRLTHEGFVFENLSSVNPATQNGKVITEAVLLQEGDIIQIGSTFFRFTEKPPVEAPLETPKKPSEFEEAEDLSTVSLETSDATRWLLKVISGPNAGAEFNLQSSSTYILGKDPNLCDVVFQDLSVSRQHARLSVDEEERVFIEDLGSRNGVVVNGDLISEKTLLKSQDFVALGTTTFLVIDREQIHETIYAPPTAVKEVRPEPLREAEAAAKEAVIEKAPPRDWKEMFIPMRHLIVAGLFVILLFLFLFGFFSLFKTQPVVVETKNETEQIKDAIKNYSDVQFSFNEATGKLFIVGHVLTNVDKQELLYLLKGLSFIQSIDNNVVVDELVWQNMNALLMTNSDWQGISIHAPSPGRFVMRGYLQTLEQLQALTDYVNVNFPYLDRLENQVVVENNLNTQIEGLLVEKGFSGVTFQLANGELVLSGRVDSAHSHQFNDIVEQFKSLRGVRQVKNFVVYTTAESARIDLSNQYKVSGFSKSDSELAYVVINGKILATGDNLDGMTITDLQPNVVLLEKDGLKFRINYNLQ